MGRHPKLHKRLKLRKGLWSPDEDEKLFNHITSHGFGCWTSVPKLAGLQRCGKSCRLRWLNYLRPNLKRGPFSQEEENLITNLHAILGNKWSQIALNLPGRTDNEIKNLWNSSLRKKIRRTGIDRDTHRPISQITDISTSNIDKCTVPTFVGNRAITSSCTSKSSMDVFFTDSNCMDNLHLSLLSHGSTPLSSLAPILGNSSSNIVDQVSGSTSPSTLTPILGSMGFDGTPLGFPISENNSLFDILSDDLFFEHNNVLLWLDEMMNQVGSGGTGTESNIESMLHRF